MSLCARPLLFAGIVLVIGLASQTSRAQDAAQEVPATAPAPVATKTVSADVVRSRLQSIESDESLDESVRGRATKIYQDILTDLEAAKSLENDRQQWLQRKAGLPGEQDILDRQFESWSHDVTLPDTSRLTQEELNKKVNEIQLELASQQTELSDLRLEPQRRSARGLAALQLISNLLMKQAELVRKQASLPVGPGVAPEVRDAEQLASDVMLSNTGLDLQRIKDEMAYYDSAEEVLNKRIELLEKTVERTSDSLKAWSDVTELRRRESAAKDIAENETKASDVPAELQPLADSNLALSRKLQELVETIEKANSDLTTTQQQTTKWNDQLARVRSLVATRSNMTESIGLLLREQRKELPDSGQLRKLSDRRRETLYDMRSEEFATGERLANFANMNGRVEQELDALSERVQPDRARELEPDVRLLLEARKKTLQQLHSDYRTYITTTSRLGVQEQTLIELVDEYRTYIDERVLWIRSTPPVTLPDLLAVPLGLNWLLSPERWRELLSAVIQQVKGRPAIHLIAAALLMGCLIYRSRAVREIHRLGDMAAAKGNQSFSVTVLALVWTFVASAAGPALVSWAAWVLSEVAGEQATEFAAPFAAAARHAAIVYWPFSFWWHSVGHKGLGEAHFQWTAASLKLGRRHLRWFIPTIMALTASYVLFRDRYDPVWERSIARFSLIAIATCTAVFVRFLLSPKTGIPSTYLSLHRNGWLDRLQVIWFPIILFVPVSFAILALMGYQYTAERLTVHLFQTVIFLSCMCLLEAIASRWIMINRRRLSIAQSKERAASGDPGPPATESTELHGGVTENSQVDLSQVNVQTHRLLISFISAATVVGLLFIWIDALPALARVNKIPLWRYEPAPIAKSVSDENVQSMPAQTPPTTTQSRSPLTSPYLRGASPTSSKGWITLGNLTGSLLVLALTYVAVRNIPGLMEIAVLQRLPLDASIRFAITTISRYAITIAGTAWAFTNVGIGWSKIQWLAAGVSVGLGFGLQEIFANFVSGLILLIERPIRAGDVVTVGDVTGTVVQIKTRATTIRDWDRRDLIVPNKVFIADKLLNWTLTDETNRIVISVGISYGGDIRRAQEIVLAAAESHPLILEDPEPSVTFDAFGENALHLTLRCFKSGMDGRLSVTHELHEMIYNDLSAAGFNIPFPQRDVHLYVKSQGKDPLDANTLRATPPE